MVIHIGDEEDGIGDSMVVVQEEEDEDCDTDDQSIVPSDDEDLGGITLAGNDAGENMETRNSQGNELVWVTTRGRRINRKRRFQCEGY